MAAEYSFQADEAYAITMLRRIRQQDRGRFVMRMLLAVAVVLALAVAGFMVVDDIPVGWLFLGGVLVTVIALPKIDEWRVRRSFRQAPPPRERFIVHLTQDGLSMQGELSEGHLKWALFRRARRFPDGLLLFAASQRSYWLPDSAADSESVAEAMRLARENIADYREL